MVGILISGSRWTRLFFKSLRQTLWSLRTRGLYYPPTKEIRQARTWDSLCEGRVGRTWGPFPNAPPGTEIGVTFRSEFSDNAPGPLS